MKLLMLKILFLLVHQGFSEPPQDTFVCKSLKHRLCNNKGLVSTFRQCVDDRNQLKLSDKDEICATGTICVSEGEEACKNPWLIEKPINLKGRSIFNSFMQNQAPEPGIKYFVAWNTGPVYNPAAGIVPYIIARNPPATSRDTTTTSTSPATTKGPQNNKN